ncbi:hypothetical protein [Saccharopolyspora sp. CA-218241]|uniref:hypothetical protein n=1 Tax=Saccharopolyspora sp. CA-218241 TaxID=3240027 RepID=UPI003D966E60
MERVHPVPGLSPGTPAGAYITNLVESINFQLRKISKNRRHFDSDGAATKLVYPGLRNITSIRGGPSGTGTWRGKLALNTPVILFPERIPLN